MKTLGDERCLLDPKEIPRPETGQVSSISTRIEQSIGRIEAHLERIGQHRLGFVVSICPGRTAEQDLLDHACMVEIQGGFDPISEHIRGTPIPSESGAKNDRDLVGWNVLDSMDSPRIQPIDDSPGDDQQGGQGCSQNEQVAREKQDRFEHPQILPKTRALYAEADSKAS